MLLQLDFDDDEAKTIANVRSAAEINDADVQRIDLNTEQRAATLKEAIDVNDEEDRVRVWTPNEDEIINIAGGDGSSEDAFRLGIIVVGPSDILCPLWNGGAIDLTDPLSSIPIGVEQHWKCIVKFNNVTKYIWVPESQIDYYDPDGQDEATVMPNEDDIEQPSRGPSPEPDPEPDPEPETEDSEADPDRMRRKLEVGLDAVLAEEGAEPLSKASAEK